MRVLYVCDFSISNASIGKNRATLQKLRALRRQVDSLKVISGRPGYGSFRILSLLIIELKAVFFICKDRPSFVISRGHVGIAFNFVARLLGVATVREVHADLLGEINLLPFSGIRRKGIYLLSLLTDFVNRRSDVRIFNHPDLLSWFSGRDKVRGSENDFFVYNGFDPSSSSRLDKWEARQKFGLSNDIQYLVFVGGASEWHGIEYLTLLQRSFNFNQDNVKIVCGGGCISAYDPSSLCINLSPLNDRDCADLIKAADLCLLPVKSNRVSPGSPLKLYDYIVNERYVAAQCGVLGYSDEVDDHQVGLAVDFPDTESTRKKILEFLAASQPPYDASKIRASWDDRINEWISHLASSSFD